MTAVLQRPGELAAWQRYIRDACGICLDDSKAYLVETRLAGLLRETGAADFTALLEKVRSDPAKTLRAKVIDSITTGETSFFRDGSPFDLLREKLLPDLIERRSRAGIRPVPIRVLSAACSSGQEIYSVAMVIRELLVDFRGYDIRLLGVDVSDQAVAKAGQGRYSRMEVDRGLSPERLTRHFQPAGDSWKVRDELRALATFRRANLLEPLASIAPFDIILCRNIAIYFDPADKARLFRNLAQTLAGGGALILGSTETLPESCQELEPVRQQKAVYYRKRP